MGNNEKLNKLVQELKDLKVQTITTVDEMSTVVKRIQLSDKPEIVTNEDSIIFFDTASYNSNYITDLIIEYLKKYADFNYKDFTTLLKFNNTNISQELELMNEIKSKLKIQTPNTKFYYCDSEDVYNYLFDNMYVKNSENNLKPVILTIKAKTYIKQKEIFIDIENLYPFNLKTIMKNIMLLHDYNSNTQFK